MLSQKTFRILSVFRDCHMVPMYGLAMHSIILKTVTVRCLRRSVPVMILWSIWSVWAWKMNVPLRSWRVYVREKVWHRIWKKICVPAMCRTGTSNPAKRSNICSQKRMRQLMLWWDCVLHGLRCTSRWRIMRHILVFVRQPLIMRSCVRAESG